jgi:hypothetical protein
MAASPLDPRLHAFDDALHQVYGGEVAGGAVRADPSSHPCLLSSPRQLQRCAAPTEPPALPSALPDPAHDDAKPERRATLSALLLPSRALRAGLATAAACLPLLPPRPPAAPATPTIDASSSLASSLPARRWTDGLGLAAAAAAASLAAVAGARATSGASPTQEEPPAEPCPLLDLPNELLLVILLAAVTPPSAHVRASACDAFARAFAPAGAARVRGAAATCAPGSPFSDAHALFSPPSSPGWSYALVPSLSGAFPTDPDPASPAATAAAHAAAAAVPPPPGGSCLGAARLLARRAAALAAAAAVSPPSAGDAGLAAAARGACTCRRLRGAYRLLLAARPDLELQVMSL